MMELQLSLAKKYNADIIKSGHIIVGKTQHKIIGSLFYVKIGRLTDELLQYKEYIWGMLIKRVIF